MVQASVSGRLAAGVRSIHLSSESPLSFQPGGASRGISDAIDAAIHTDLPAHPYAGATAFHALKAYLWILDHKLVGGAVVPKYCFPMDAGSSSWPTN